MTTSLHVIRGAGTPAFVPPCIGAHYYDTLNLIEYVSFGTVSISDWRVRGEYGPTGATGTAGATGATGGIISVTVSTALPSGSAAEGDLWFVIP